MTIIDSSVVIDEHDVKIYVEAGKERKAMGSAFGRESEEHRKPERSEDVFGQGLELAANCARRIARTMRSLYEDERPDSFDVQFGLQLDSDSGPFICKDASSAQLKVSMTWKKERKAD